MNTQPIESIPTEQLENQLIMMVQTCRHVALAQSASDWAVQAVKELQLRRLAMSAP